MSGTLSYEQETGHWYRDLDGIRLVYEETRSGESIELVGWYRPDGWKKDYSRDPYAIMARNQLE